MNKNKFSLTNWIKSYSKKLVLLIFIILIPIFIISLFFYQFNFNNKKFYFDKVNDKPSYLRPSVISKEKRFNEVFDDFNIKLTRVSDIKRDDKIYEFSNFTFTLDYDLNSYYENSNVQIRWILKTNYTDIQSSTRNFSGDKDSMDYVHEIPNYRYLVFKVKKPIAYFEVNITKPGQLDEKKVTLYYKLDTNKAKGYDYIPIV